MTPLLPDQIYHVYNHANGQDVLFREPDNYRYFLDKYAYHIHPVAETYAYCLLPNHLHLMIRIRSEDVLMEVFKEKLALRPDRFPKPVRSGKGLGNQKELLQRNESTQSELHKLISQQFSHLWNGYVKAYNKRYDRAGSLFQRPFKRKHITNPGYYKNLLAYIHWNPVHHSLVTEVDDWAYSSWPAYVLDKLTNVARSQVIDWFGDKAAFFAYHKSMKGKDVMLEFG